MDDTCQGWFQSLFNSEGVTLLYPKEKIDNRNPERVILLLEKDGDAMLTLKG